jgi:hypothetical protein
VAAPSVPANSNDRSIYLDQPAQLAGDTLLHTDYNPENILITPDGTARLIDWAWPTCGAGWIDPCCLLIRLIAAGHTAHQAETGRSAPVHGTPPLQAHSTRSRSPVPASGRRSPITTRNPGNNAWRPQRANGPMRA